MLIRPITPSDEEALWSLLCLASYRDLEGTRAEPRAARYLVGFPRPDDFGFLAFSDDTGGNAGALLGGAWARPCLFGTPGTSLRESFNPGADVPMLAVATYPAAEGQGVATQLLQALISDARERGWRALGLDVREDNAARRIYQKLGFIDAPGAYFVNSVGGYSYGMLLELR